MKEREIYKVLGSEVRRRILVYIGDKGRVRFTDMKRDLGLSVGSLYYHLDLMRELITRGKDKSYTLTPEGLKVYQRLKGEGIKSVEGPKTGFLGILFLSPLFEFLNQRLKVSLFSASISIMLLITISGISRIEMLGLYPLHGSRAIPVLTVLSSLFGLWLLLDIISSIIYGRFGVNHVQFFSQISLIYLIYYTVLSLASICDIVFPTYLFILIQAWLSLIIGTSVSISKGIRLERGFMITLLTLYLNTAMIMLIGENM